jgi:hypothetical protein
MLSNSSGTDESGVGLSLLIVELHSASHWHERTGVHDLLESNAPKSASSLSRTAKRFAMNTAESISGSRVVIRADEELGFPE